MFESADGVAPLAQVGGDITATAFNRPLALHWQLNAQYKVQACNSQGCTDSATLTVASQMSDLAKLRSAVGYVKASNTGASSAFGYSVALSADGNTLAVGATGESSNATGVGGDQTDNSASSAGAVYVYSRSGSTWVQQAYVKASNTGADDYFGASVALSADGNTLAVGAPWEDSNAIGIGGDQANNSATNAGAVYVYSRSGTSWSQQAYVKASNTGAGDFFGWSVALSADGNTLAVGATLEDSNAIGVNGNQANNSSPDAGAVYVFSRRGSTWVQQAYVKASNTGADDYFGENVALSADGNTLA
ncbi:MAG: FG-GAP repeat protein, partial [bacterium]